MVTIKAHRPVKSNAPARRSRPSPKPLLCHSLPVLKRGGSPLADVKRTALHGRRREIRTRPQEATIKFENLTPEQQEKAKACKTPEEVIVLAKEEGYNLSDEELEAVSGGREW